MTWVRYDDNVANHPKVAPLDDATYRLWREAIEWCARNLTDGLIQDYQLTLTSVRANKNRAEKLVEKGLWHARSGACFSEKCPPFRGDGWVVHDYWDYQPPATRVRAEQAASRERQRKYIEQVRARKGQKANAVTNAVTNASPNGVSRGVSDGEYDAYPVPVPSRPAPKGGDGTTSRLQPPAAYGDGAPAGGEQKIICRTCGNATTSAYHRNTCLRSDAIAEGAP